MLEPHSEQDQPIGRLATQRWNLVVGAVGLVVSAAFGVFIGFAAVTAILSLVVSAAAVVFVWWRKRRSDDNGPVALAEAVGAYLGAGIIVFGLIQLVPIGRDHSNPPVTGEPEWADARTRELMIDACFGCHSNEVEYPWYANVAPISWAVEHHVDEGRGELNYSEFTTSDGEFDETIESILEGEMPPRYYTSFGMHPEANLSSDEIDELVAGLRATPGLSEGGD